MDTPKVALAIIVIIFFLFGLPDVEAPRSQGGKGDLSMVAKQQAIELLNDTEYGGLDAEKNLWINITGLRQNDGYAWELLPLVKQRVVEQSQTILDVPVGSRNVAETPSESSNSSSAVRRSSMYQNITGIVTGHWTQSKVAVGHSIPVMNLSTLAADTIYNTKAYTRNITGHSGSLEIEFDEKKSWVTKSGYGSAREVHASMAIKDQTSKGDGWKMDLHGIHFQRQGRVLLATTSERFPGIFALPHFATNKNEFSLAQGLLNQTVNAVLAQEASSLNIPYFAPWTSSPDDPTELLFPTPHCEYIVYMQQYPTTLPAADIDALEQELRFPIGAPMPAVPALRMSALMFSPDCGFVLESRGQSDYGSHDGLHLIGPKLESYIQMARRSIFALAMIICAELFLSIRQMNETSTPSTRSRVSFYTVAMMNFGDGLAFVGLAAVAITNDVAFLPLISTTFLSFLCVGVFGMKFMMEIWAVQAPERLEREHRNAATDNIPSPATARRATDNSPTTVILPPDQDFAADEAENATRIQRALGSAQSETSAIYTQFYFVLFSISFLSLHASTWPTTLRSTYTNSLAFCYLSFWVPQIHRNIIRNCRQALRWEFVIGQSILRLTPLVYLYTVEGNVLFVEVDRYSAIALIGWVWVQIWALISQEVLGPRFCIPNGWAPPAYDYHPILREDDSEAGSSMPIGFTVAESSSSASTSGTSNDGKRLFDCAICMQTLQVNVVPGAAEIKGGDGNASSSATNIFSRRAYMVTPCRHIFHSHCLQGWMRYRLQCPICRENLPPL